MSGPTFPAVAEDYIRLQVRRSVKTAKDRREVGARGSQDKTVALVRASGFVRAVEHPVRGRAAAINRGVAEARSPLVCVLHADTILPDDALIVIRRTLANPQTALAGFTPLIAGAETVRWGTTFHNWTRPGTPQ